MAADIDDLVEQIGRLADAIDELVGSNTQMMDIMAQQIQRDIEAEDSDDESGPRYLDEPAPPEDRAEADA